jgi:hypothetical protein
MKKVLLGAVIALAGGATLAHADTAGIVDLAYRNIDSSGSIDGVRFGGQVVAPLSGGWSAQFDARMLRISASGSDETLSYGTAHATYTSGEWKLGGFVSAESVFGEGVYGIGADGQYNFSNASITGQVGYDSADNGGGDGWTVGGDGRYFFTDDLLVNVHYSHLFTNGAFGFSTSDVDTYGIGGEYKFQSSPVSVFADYQVASPDNSSSTDLKTFTIGVRYAFGDGTLLQRQKTGPSLLPNAPFGEDLF